MIELDVFRRGARAVDDGRNLAGAPQAAARTFALVGTAFGRDFMNGCHFRVTSGCMMSPRGDLE
jgi:hypothetical protein